MCGRIFQTLPLKRLLQIARTKNVSNQEMHTASFNVCPTTYIPVIKSSHLYPSQQEQNPPQIEQSEEEKDLCPNREVTFMKWGCKTDHNLIINGRIQELSSKRTFLKIIQNRCVVIMEGYYEWQSKDKPFSFKPKSGDHFLVAALYSDSNEIIILTKDAVAPLNKVHERMPVILSSEEIELWLDPKNTKDIMNIIQKSILDKQKGVWKNVGFAQVSPYVNKRDQKSIKCLMTVEEYKKQLDKTGLMRFWKKAEKIETVGKDGETLQQKSKGSNPQAQIKEPSKKMLVQENSPEIKQAEDIIKKGSEQVQ